MTDRVRVAVCADFREEGWPSMDRVADNLLTHLARDHADTVEAVAVCPPFRRRASRLWPAHATANIDRGWNRLVDYPRHVDTLAGRYDVFHVVDHSYAQLVHRTVAERTVVTCHDLDTFRSILEPDREPRSPFFKAMTRHILAGFKRAACVTCDSGAVRDELVARRVVPADRIVVAPIGVSERFSAAADPATDAEVDRLIDAPPGAVEVLHVGSSAPRKRVDVLLRSIARAVAQMPALRLIRVGAPFTPEQQALVDELNLQPHISVLPALDDRMLASVYRRSAIVMLPSDREGFGLPLVEAMACGTPVLVSDIPVLREVGGAAAVYCSPGDVDAWSGELVALLRDRTERPNAWTARREAGVAWSQHFTWARFADRLAGIYCELARTAPPLPSRKSETCPA